MLSWLDEDEATPTPEEELTRRDDVEEWWYEERCSAAGLGLSKEDVLSALMLLDELNLVFDLVVF